MKNFPPSAGISENDRSAENRDGAFSFNSEGELALSVRADIQDSFDSIRASGDLERPLRNFIMRCETEIGKTENPEEKNKKTQALEQGEIHLMHALGDFYESLDHLVSSEIDFDPAEVAKVSQIRSLIHPDFLNRIMDYYQSFEACLSPVLKGAATRGASYFMDSNLSYSEAAADEIDRLLQSMRYGNQALADMAQRHSGEGLLTVDHESLMRKMNSIFPKRKRQGGAAEGLAFSMLSSELGQRVLRDLKSESPEALKNALLNQIQMNLNGMCKGVANQVSPVFEKEEVDGKSTRILSLMEPARQLELFYDILNMSMGFARNARLQKTILFPSGQTRTDPMDHSRFIAVR